MESEIGIRPRETQVDAVPNILSPQTISFLVSKMSHRTSICVYYRFATDNRAQRDNSELRQNSELLEECVKRDWQLVWIDGDKATSGDAVIKPML